MFFCIFCSLMADMLQSAPNANTGFMIYSAMLSLGSCVGYLLSAVDWQTLGMVSNKKWIEAIFGHTHFNFENSMAFFIGLYFELN